MCAGKVGELTNRMFGEYKAMMDQCIPAFGKTRWVNDLAPDDFARLRESRANRWCRCGYSTP